MAEMGHSRGGHCGGDLWMAISDAICSHIHLSPCHRLLGRGGGVGLFGGKEIKLKENRGKEKPAPRGQQLGKTSGCRQKSGGRRDN